MEMVEDPYMDLNRCIKRLYSEYIVHKKLIIAVDYDDTVFNFHENSQTHNKVLSILKRAQKQGHYIVVFTASDKKRHASIAQFMIDNKIVANSINENPIKLPYGNHGKIYFNILLDDRAGLGQAYETLSKTLDLIDKSYI